MKFYLTNNIVNRKDQDGNALMHILAKKGEYKLIRYLTKDVNINIKDQNDLTTLHWAVLEKNHQVAETFGSIGAKINVQDVTGQTPTHKTVIIDDFKMVEILLKYKENLNTIDATSSMRYIGQLSEKMKS